MLHNVHDIFKKWNFNKITLDLLRMLLFANNFYFKVSIINEECEWHRIL